MRSSVKVALTVGLFAFVAGAKSPATLMTQFNDALPSGTEARMVWGQLNGSTNELWGVDSRDGVARKIGSSTGNVMNPQLTYDATRVVFYDNNAGKIKVINWDGTGLTAGVTASERIEDYWKDPASSNEYVVMYQGGAGYTKVNIATGASQGLCSGGDDGARLSLDGTKMAVYSDAGLPSILNVSGCGTFRSESCNSGGDGCGCVINISPDNNYRIMRQISGHVSVKVTGAGTPAAGTITILTSTAGGVFAVNTARNTCVGADPEFEQTRWVHPEMITFYVINLPDNPYLFNISTKKWVSIQDNMGCFSDGQSADAIVSATLPGNVAIGTMPAPLGIGALPADARAYAIDGRLIGKTGPHNGVTLSPSANRLVRAIRR